MGSIYGLVIQLGLALLVSLIVYSFLAKSLIKMLDEVVRLPAATSFYIRILGIIIALISLSSALYKQPDVKENAAFMEYVWYYGMVLSSIFEDIFWFLCGYLLIVTILVAALRPRSE